MYCGVHGCGASPSREIRTQRANALDCLGTGTFFYEIGSFEIMEPRKNTTQHINLFATQTSLDVNTKGLVAR